MTEFVDECARLVIHLTGPSGPMDTTTRALAWWYGLSDRTASSLIHYAQWHASPVGRSLNGGKPE